MNFCHYEDSNPKYSQSISIKSENIMRVYVGKFSSHPVMHCRDIKCFFLKTLFLNLTTYYTYFLQMLKGQYMQ